MGKSICGADCARCPWKESCGGCEATGGRPFGGACLLAECCRKKGRSRCEGCGEGCELKKGLMAEFNGLGIEDMPEVTELYALPGSFVNLEYDFPGGKVKLWDDRRIYLGAQLEQKTGERCYGLAADEGSLLVSEYGEGGGDAEIVLYKKRNI